MTVSKTVAEKSQLSVKTQTLATIFAILLAVVLPQAFHFVGRISGFGTVPGEVFLPMHLSIILVGLYAGMYTGAAAGFVSPLISFYLTGMPTVVMLPFMVVELTAYGVIAGILRNKRIPLLGKVLLVQVGGRALRAIAIVIGIYLLGVTGISASVIWSSILTGLPGLLIQWSVLPLLLYWMEHAGRE